MSSVLIECGLHDLTHKAHPHINFATCARGKLRIDYALGTKKFLTAVNTGSYEPWGYHCVADHRLFYLEFDARKLFGNAHLLESKPTKWKE